MTFHLFKGGVKQVLTKVKKNKEVRGRAHQLLVIAIILGTLPMTALAEGQPQPKLLDYSIDQSTIAFNQTTIEPIQVQDLPSIDIKIGESKADEAAREAAQKARTHQRAFTVQSVTTTSPDASTKRALVQQAASSYDVPWQIVEAVWQVESGKSWDTAVHSSAGAQGPAQFLPATWKHYGVDADGDGKANIHDAQDAVHTEARYLAANGANRGQIRQALFAYNHADWYVNKVLKIADELGYTG